MTTHQQVCISAETPEQADDILNALLSEKLVTGGQIIASPARFLWKGEVVAMQYLQVQSFCLAVDKGAIIDLVKKHSAEEAPMTWFTDLDGNQELLDWITSTVKR